MSVDLLEKTQETYDFSVSLDRCDRCDAQAMYRSLKDGLDLMWCAHHFTEHEAHLLLGGWNILTNDKGLQTLGIRPAL